MDGVAFEAGRKCRCRCRLEDEDRNSKDLPEGAIVNATSDFEGFEFVSS